MFKMNANAETQLVKLKVQESQAHYACVQRKPDGNPWYHDILRYIKDQQYLELANDNDKRTLRRLAMDSSWMEIFSTRKVKTKHC